MKKTTRLIFCILLIAVCFPWLLNSESSESSTNGTPNDQAEQAANSLYRSKVMFGAAYAKLESMGRRLTDTKGKDTLTDLWGQGQVVPATGAAIPDQIIVKYKKRRTTEASRAAIAARHHLRQKKYISFVDLHVYKLADARNQRRVLKDLKANPNVEYAEPDYILSIHARTVPDDPSFSMLWGLDNSSQTGGTADADIDAPEAWGLCTGSRDVVVAVVDTGVDYNHSDLAANMWRNPGETAGDGIDNDGNGYIDDVFGINAITHTGDPFDDHSHGTHCAGTIGAVGNNGIGVAGVNWRVKIMAVKFITSGGWGTTSDAVTGIQYAIDKGAHIMSNSWGGGGYSQSLADAIELARQRGILFIAAAGNSAENNDNTPFYPSSYPHDNVISVAATDHGDQLAYFSCYGSTSVDVAAPGVSVYSTLPGNSYASYSGTSMATPHVAGLAALIKAYQPTLTAAQIKSRIINTVEVLPALEGKILSNGRINALFALTDNAPPSVQVTNPHLCDIVSGTVNITASASDSNGIADVAFYIDNVLKYTDTAAPWSYSWDSTTAANANHTLRVVVTDTLNRSASSQVWFRVNNTGLPGVMITQPASGSPLMGTVLVDANAAYNAGIVKLEFYIDGTEVSEVNTPPYQYSWRTSDFSNGSHTITVKAYGTDSTVGQDQVTVTINNIMIPTAEREALVAFFNSTNGTGWTKNTNWIKDDGSINDPGTEFSWYGVTVVNNHVICISLCYNNLTGTLPVELENLTELQILSIYYNDINGPVLPQLGSLSKLTYLDLDGNNFSGTIPPELGNLSQLRTLWLCSNPLSGGIPLELCNLSNLEYLYLFNANLTGTIPPEIGNLTKLKTLSLYYNDFSGTIPPALGNLTQLLYLDLDGNNLTGTIPAELGQLVNLQVLWLCSNNLTGSFPVELTQLSQLQHLYLYSNNLSGSLPPEIGNLNKMVILYLDNNDFSGELPVNIKNMSNIQLLWLSYNEFSGSIPADWGVLTELRYLALYNNQLTGEIPAGIGNLSNLIYFVSSNNQLTGSIPAQLGNLSNLEYLYLYRNQLTGNIPPELGNLSKLRYMDLSGNMLKGDIPGEIIQLKTLTQSPAYCNIGYNGLYASQETVRTFLNTVSVGWNTSQTIAPTSVSAEALSYSSIIIRWSPIAYTGNTGKYIIYASLTPGGPYTQIGSTVNKAASSFTVNNLLPGTTYYYVIRTQTDAHSYNGNVILSEYSSEVSVTTPGGPSLTVISPNGGETLHGCTSYTISWTSDGNVGNVTIEYSTAGTSGTFIPIVGSVTNSGSYTWTPPSIDSTQCAIRVRELDGSPSDTSNAVFTIAPCPALTLTAPDGGEVLQRGRPFTISWTSESIEDNLTIKLYKNNVYISDIATTAVTNGSYNWNIPQGLTVGSDYKIRIVQGSVYDQSNNNFSIVGFKHFADFNQDGKPDILWRNYEPTGGWNSIWLMNGTQIISVVATKRLVDPYWEIAGTGDFNSDGKTDILWRYYGPNGGWNMVWLMNGNSMVSTVLLPRIADTKWRIECTGDFNGDGYTDILLRYYGNPGGWNMVWFFNNTTKIGSANLPMISNLDWKIESSGDFNNDGKTDIVLRYYGTGGWNLVWFLNGTTRIGSTYISPISDLNWKFAGSGDFNRDGNTDLILRNYDPNGGWNVLWYFNLTTKVSQVFLPQVKGDKWRIDN